MHGAKWALFRPERQYHTDSIEKQGIPVNMRIICVYIYMCMCIYIYMDISLYPFYKSGWWFQTCFIFHFIYGM